MYEIKKADDALKKLLPPVKLRLDADYIPSQFCLAFEHEGKNYVFNTLTKQFVEAALPESARAGEGYDDLIRAQLLVPKDRDECAYYNGISAIYRVYNRKKGVQSYTILPTFACNARCVYCYEEGVKPLTMDAETVEQCIRYILSSRQGDQIHLAWFGGEPLLCPDIIDRICAGVREAGLLYTSSMISNGSLITPAIIEKMTGDWKLKRIQISVDGAEEDYIARKRYLQYHDEYHRVMENINALSKAGIRVKVRCNVDERNWDNTPRFLEDMAAAIEYKENVSLYFAPLNQTKKREGFLSLCKKISETGNTVMDAGFRICSQAINAEHFRMNHCMADAGDVVISPDGGLYPCEHCPPESRFGDIWQGVTDEKARREFCRVDRTREKCRTCPFLPICTSFSACPIEVGPCREMQKMLALELLKAWIDKAQVSDGADDEITFC